MAQSTVKLTIRNGGLGLSPGASESLHVKLGTAVGGTVNVLSQYASRGAILADLVTGPAAEAAAFSLARGTGSVGVVPCAAASAGVAGSTVHTGGGLGTVVASGTPYDSYELRVKILKAGAVGTATYALSLDAGRNYGAETTSGASIVLTGTGVTIAFDSTAGPFVLGDVYAVACTPPVISATTVLAALDALLLDSAQWGHVHLVGTLPVLADQVSLAASINARLETAFTNGRDAFAIIELPVDTDANLRAAISAFVGTRISFCAGRQRGDSALRTTRDWRSSAWSISARIAVNRISRDAAAFADGALGGIDAIDRDEGKTPGLDDARVSTLCTYNDEPGFFVTHALIADAPGGDYKNVVSRRVIDKACKVVRKGLRRYLNVEVRVKKDTGTILPAEAQAIEAYITGLLNVALINPVHASSVSFVVDRTNNILSTEELSADLSVVPLGYARSINASVGLVNPAVAAV